MSTVDYTQKFAKIVQNTLFEHLSEQNRLYVKAFAHSHRLSQQQLKQLVDMVIDITQWREPSPREKNFKNFAALRAYHERLQNKDNRYDGGFRVTPEKIKLQSVQKNGIGFGMCPVASPKTRCCNLLTLDSVESCGFDCSYCSIQSFYNGNTVTFHENLGQNLQQLELDPSQLYHIGTGQSSDSLMWGDRYGTLSALNAFAKTHPNVILEMKTKSDNTAFFEQNEIAKNIIVTWSLNPQTIIDNEEHLTAPLHKRLQAAKKLHDRGILVGFHFHPMIHFQNWEREYAKICEELLRDFDPARVAMVSMGTLTFIKPVIQKIRKRKFHSKILQMPLRDAGGKLSYPQETKKRMFQHLYGSLTPWHEKVYFYLCMEDHSLWREVFDREYSTNESFELDMKLHYKAKIESL